MKTMKQYVEEHIDILESYCKENSISLQKVLSFPMCYTQDEMFIQYHDASKDCKMINDKKPAKVLLTITKNISGGLVIKPSEDIREFL